MNRSNTLNHGFVWSVFIGGRDSWENPQIGDILGPSWGENEWYNSNNTTNHVQWWLGLGQTKKNPRWWAAEGSWWIILGYPYIDVYMYTHVYTVYLQRTIWTVYLIVSMTKWGFFVEATWILRELRWFEHKTMGTDFPPNVNHIISMDCVTTEQ